MKLVFLKLKIKEILRGNSVGLSIVMQLFKIMGYVNMMILMVAAAFLFYYEMEEKSTANANAFLSKYFIIFWVIDLIIKYIWLDLSTMNIKPFLSQNIKKKTLVKHMTTNAILSPFTWIGSLFFIMYGILAGMNSEMALPILSWTIAVVFLLYSNSLIALLIKNNNTIPTVLGAIALALFLLDYYALFPVLNPFGRFFSLFYQHSFLSVLPIAFFFSLLFWFTKYLRKQLYLDELFSEEKTIKQTENNAFFSRFGKIGAFISLDIKMLKRNAATKNVMISAFFFLFYGLLMNTGDVYKTMTFRFFMGMMVTGGFQFIFGQRVPAFDSAYYPLMMTQNTLYIQYLKAKWWLMNAVTLCSIIISAAYIYFGLDIYLLFIAGGIYNIGVNSQFVLWSGAYNREKIDLNSKEKRLGKKGNFSLKTFLLIIPQMVVPCFTFFIINHFFGKYSAIASVIILGILGFMFRNFILNKIVMVYKNEKYSTLAAFK